MNSEAINRFQIYVDMDGVLADFDAHYEAVFGVRADKRLDNVDWGAVRESKDFYLNIPPMSDMQELRDFVWQFKPIVLTGIPSSVEEAADNKRAWILRHLGPEARVICCLSRNKYLHCQPGDVLIDDWPKYAQRWQDVGGHFIEHRSAKESIAALKALLAAEKAK